jgi:hypothetical protein
MFKRGEISLEAACLVPAPDGYIYIDNGAGRVFKLRHLDTMMKPPPESMVEWLRVLEKEIGY